ncbi:hypothetical protein L3Y34_009600 [Caenorhabditis briggsae]|uniref:Uncharacterized protein n=1 Tax=Caenorhabditis briggsae TaxID=6238 RepID=A0AAE9D370_CAEBR|nr:hypothetical protein L3Y34_009600 [Caenorhabditis briggsae]
MKWPLFINHSWSVWIDFGLCTLSTPYIFLPTTSFIGVGILSFFGLSYIPQMAAGALSALCEFICLSTFANSVFHWACTIYYLFVAPPSRSTSAETRRAQRHFLIGTMIQTSIPGYYNQGLMNLGIIFYGLNGLVESLAILSVYRPYRNAVKDILNFRKSKEPKVQTIPVREVCGNSGFGRTHLRI